MEQYLNCVFLKLEKLNKLNCSVCKRSDSNIWILPKFVSSPTRVFVSLPLSRHSHTIIYPELIYSVDIIGTIISAARSGSTLFNYQNTAFFKLVFHGARPHPTPFTFCTTRTIPNIVYFTKSSQQKPIATVVAHSGIAVFLFLFRLYTYCKTFYLMCYARQLVYQYRSFCKFVIPLRWISLEVEIFWLTAF